MSPAVDQATWPDYSQSGEQALILDAIATLGLTQGRFLDIGAGDGETFSNTRALARQGWRGVAVEPAAWAFDRLSALCHGTDVTPVSAVVMPVRLAPLVPFAYSRGDHLSSTDAKQLARWSQVPFENGYAAAVGLHELLGQLGPFDVVSIDAEGLTLGLVEAYLGHPMWAEVRVIVYELDAGEFLDLRVADAAGMWARIGRTPNNVVYAR